MKLRSINLHKFTYIFNGIDKEKMYLSFAVPGGNHPLPPQTGPNSFIFAYVSAENHPSRRSMPPQRVGAPKMGNPRSATVLNY